MLVELNIPVVKLNPPKSKVPLVNVVVPVATRDNAEFDMLVVPPTLLTVSAAIVLLLGVIVPVPTIVAVNAVYVPPELSVKLFKFKVVVPSAKAVVPKFNVLNQLPVVSVATAVPDPVSDRFVALVVEPPPRVPKTNALVIPASAANPPVPVYVNPVTVPMLNTVVDAVV